MASSGDFAPLPVKRDLGSLVEFPKSLPAIYILQLPFGEMVDSEAPECPPKGSTVRDLFRDFGQPGGFFAGATSAARFGKPLIGHATTSDFCSSLETGLAFTDCAGSLLGG